MTNPTNTPQDAVERVERLLAAFQLLPDSATVYNLNLGDLRTLLSLTKPDEEMVAEVLANQVSMRNGAPYIKGCLHLMPPELATRFREDARAAIKAITLDLYDGES